MVDHLDALVLQLVRERVARVGIVESDSTVDVDALHAEVERITAKRDAYLDPEALDDLGGMEVVRPTVRKLNERLAQVERELADASHGRPNLSELRTALDEFENLPLAEQREVLASVVESVTVNRSERRGRGVPLADRVVVVGFDGEVLGQ
jgi:hypothetical protein